MQYSYNRVWHIALCETFLFCHMSFSKLISSFGFVLISSLRILLVRSLVLGSEKLRNFKEHKKSIQKTEDVFILVFFSCVLSHHTFWLYWKTNELVAFCLILWKINHALYSSIFSALPPQRPIYVNFVACESIWKFLFLIGYF